MKGSGVPERKMEAEAIKEMLILEQDQLHWNVSWPK